MIGVGPTALSRIADLLYWSAQYVADDTITHLRLLCMLDQNAPELDDLYATLDRVELLLGVYLARLQGAEIHRVDGEYIVDRLPEL